MARTLMCEIITPERIVYTNEVEMVIAPTVDGEIGILPLHAPLVSALRSGEIRVKWDGEKEVEWFAVAGGYIQVHEDKVIILADNAVVSSQIDVERARHALELAKERLDALPAAQGPEFDNCSADLNWCETQLEVAARHK